MALAPVVPTSIDRAKRLAKALHVAYPDHTLAQCQALTAHLLFHQDWHALETAIKSGLPGASFDEDMDEETVAARYDAQLSLLCRETADLDASKEYPPPPHLDLNTREGLLGMLGSMSPHNQQRLKMATCRWTVQHALTVLMELEPTAGHLPETSHYLDILSTVSVAWLQELPFLLSRWCARNLPPTAEDVTALANYSLNTNKASSLLRLGLHWGQMCYTHSRTIQPKMMMGIAFLIGERYASLRTQDTELFDRYRAAVDSASAPELRAMEAELHQTMMYRMTEFFQVFPRDDFVDLFSGGSLSFQKYAKECITILSRPNSRRGVQRPGKR